MKNTIMNILIKAGVKKNAEAIAIAIVEQFSEQRQAHPTYVDNGRTMVWCSRHGDYHEIEYMVPNKSKKDGVANYCKPAQRRWEWMHKYSQLLMAKSAKFFIDGNMDIATHLVSLSKQLAAEKNSTQSFQDITLEMTSEEVVNASVEKYIKDVVEYLK